MKSKENHKDKNKTGEKLKNSNLHQLFLNVSLLCPIIGTF